MLNFSTPIKLLILILLFNTQLLKAQYEVTLTLVDLEVLELDEGPFDDAEDLWGFLAVFGYRMENKDGKIEMKNSYENSSLSPKRMKNINKPGVVTKFLWDINFTDEKLQLKKGQKHTINQSLTFRNLTLDQVRSLKIRFGGQILDQDFGLAPSFTA
jgi:hypothetical protein